MKDEQELEVSEASAVPEPPLTEGRMAAIAAQYNLFLPRQKGESLCDYWLRKILTKAPRNGQEVKHLGIDAGFTWMQVKRSATKLEVIKTFTPGWYVQGDRAYRWSLPDVPDMSKMPII